MKNLLYIFLVAGFLLSSCEEEDNNPLSPTLSSSFSCKIDGEQLVDHQPDGIILTTTTYAGALEIIATSSLPNGRVMNEVKIRIGSGTSPFSYENFQTDTDYELKDATGHGRGFVWRGSDTYETSGLPGCNGTIRFSKLASNKISGTFSFQGSGVLGVTSGVCVVTDGEFSNVSY